MKSGALGSWVVLLAFLFVAAGPAIAQDAKPAATVEPARSKTLDDAGLIFNFEGALLDLGAYQAGIGMKLGWDNLRLRMLLDVVAGSASDSYAVKLGTTLERHLTPEPLSLYVGGSAGAGYMLQGANFSSVVFTVGAVAGVEFFPLKFLSLFVEYTLAADFTLTTDLSSSTTTFDYLVDARMGNDSTIGIVVYFKRPTTATIPATNTTKDTKTKPK
jgi:hypothetical protein